jgi:antagonist of KipI
MIMVIRPGRFTTIQDQGRWGFQTWGMPVSGALDPLASRIANILAGNKEQAALLEMTDEGGVFHFDYSVQAALAGAEMQASLNGRRLKNWSSFIIPPGGVLSLGEAVSGRRAYLALRGGIEAPLVMGSRSTYVAAGLGGLEGRPLLPGDMLEIGTEQVKFRTTRELSANWRPKYTRDWLLRLVLGPQEDWFSEADHKRFFNSVYQVGTVADRMTCELTGPALTLPERELVSDATGWGAVEVPACGLPSIVMPDHGTTRGFAKIGYVIQADFYKLAQASPGDKVRFEAMDAENAADLDRLQRADFNALAESFD